MHCDSLPFPDGANDRGGPTIRRGQVWNIIVLHHWDLCFFFIFRNQLNRHTPALGNWRNTLWTLYIHSWNFINGIHFWNSLFRSTRIHTWICQVSVIFCLLLTSILNLYTDRGSVYYWLHYWICIFSPWAWSIDYWFVRSSVFSLFSLRCSSKSVQITMYMYIMRIVLGHNF